MQPDKTAMLTMPGYQGLTMGASRGFWRCTRTPNRVHYRYNEGSLLSQNFNAMWCSALNMVHKGDPLDYFAMQHADIAPQDFWLDALIDELDHYNLDMLGVIVPIKDPKGLTSCALARPDGDPWRPHCRLTMNEVYQLPETFTSDHVGYPLLLNTGLWVCRFGPEWLKRKVHFTINDDIVYSRKADSYQAIVEPEDWYFSRRCHEYGLKIGATRKIQVTHRGGLDYSNAYPWGEDYDRMYVDKSILNSWPDGTWKFPNEVDGWLTYEEGKALADLARDKRVLEIGSYCGRSTICMAQTARNVTAVDPHDGTGTGKYRETLPEIKRNLLRHNLTDKVNILHPNQSDEYLSGGPYDLVFIDGDHEYDSVRDDIDIALTVVADDGLIVFHDYREHEGEWDGGWDEGVTKAVQEFMATGAKLVSRHNTLAVLKPPAHILTEV